MLADALWNCDCPGLANYCIVFCHAKRSSAGYLSIAVAAYSEWFVFNLFNASDAPIRVSKGTKRHATEENLDLDTILETLVEIVERQLRKLQLPPATPQ